MICLRDDIDPNEFEARARRVRLILMDCDGVLTDGRLYFGSSGEMIKVFDVKDGQGIGNWHALGFQTGIVTGRAADEILAKRAGELQILYLRTRSADKARDVREIAAAAGIELNETAFVGDDIGDIPAMEIVGFPVIVADATREVCQHALAQTSNRGGRGAVRELIDYVISLK